MKKKGAGIIIFVFSLILVLFIFNVDAKPSYGSDHYAGGCHSSSGYTIYANISTTVEANASSNILFYVNATGSNVYIYAYNGYRDNNKFIYNDVDLTTKIQDDGPYDNNSASGQMQVFVNITTPSTAGYYYLSILAGDLGIPPGSAPNFVETVIGISVGGAAPPLPQIDIFSHLGIYLGSAALILITLGTLLVLYNENKFVKIHGYLAGASWILTLINVILLVRVPLGAWAAFNIAVHWPHIVFGAVGLVTGLFSMLFGIAAERRYSKITGYITLGCWWTAFLLGLLLIF